MDEQEKKMTDNAGIMADAVCKIFNNQTRAEVMTALTLVLGTIGAGQSKRDFRENLETLIDNGYECAQKMKTVDCGCENCRQTAEAIKHDSESEPEPLEGAQPTSEQCRELALGIGELMKKVKNANAIWPAMTLVFGAMGLEIGAARLSLLLGKLKRMSLEAVDDMKEGKAVNVVKDDGEPCDCYNCQALRNVGLSEGQLAGLHDGQFIVGKPMSPEQMATLKENHVIKDLSQAPEEIKEQLRDAIRTGKLTVSHKAASDLKDKGLSEDQLLADIAKSLGRVVN